ncbi:DNA repair protein RadA [Porphyromonas miyakawae]|uniref:DNA repair protein RadA n=1 Tax=Porphyromonas miyakawae TaxID=3137470 RepID=A0ABQ0E162_9PORP
MAKARTVYVCSNCGANYTKWQGQCSFCKSWNTLTEENEPSGSGKEATLAEKIIGTTKGGKPHFLKDITSQQEARITLADSEFNRVLGGGLVRGSFVLLGGDPGIGKSTLILQTVVHTKGLRTLYVSGEESEYQIKMRAERIGISDSEPAILTVTDIEAILNVAEEFKPDLLVIDSIQTVSTSLSESSPGSPAQIKECANLLLRYAKSQGVSVIVIGHITKEGTLAGPKVLEHTVDTVLQFEGDRHYQFRILRASKNRFGSTSELGIYEMEQTGLRIVDNPSEHFISKNMDGLSGRAIAAALEGNRPLLIEAQGLVSSAVYPNPQRSSTGFDLRRLNMLLAVLEKRVGFKLLRQDVFMNIAGGIRINDPAVDLAILLAILSSTIDKPIPGSVCFAGEVGLNGEIRAVNRIRERVAEADRLGYKAFFLPSDNMKGLLQKDYSIRLIGTSNVEGTFRKLFSHE